MSTLTTYSNGVGRQSVAMYALVKMGRLPAGVFLFANTGDDSEHPDTIAYYRDVMKPDAHANGIEMHELQRTMRDGTTETILSRIERTARSEVIPVRSSADGPPMSRSCTVDFKIETLGRWLKANGATADSPATVNVGISLDEVHRANRTPRPYEHIVYPLLDQRIRRVDCDRIIRDAGLPLPPKSSCWFCPHHSFNAWLEIRDERPDLFEKAVELEQRLSAKAGAPRYLTRYGKPLDQAIPEGVETLSFDDSDGACMSGVCNT